LSHSLTQDLPNISPNFEINDGEVTVLVSSFSNISSIEMTILEGRYIDKMMKMIITDVDTVSQIIHNEFNQGESATIEIDAAPALV